MKNTHPTEARVNSADTERHAGEELVHVLRGREGQGAGVSHLLPQASALYGFKEAPVLHVRPPVAGDHVDEPGTWNPPVQNKHKSR